ncbi:MAG: alpha-glucan family phosphorylase [Deltaproteobacteria bacterium]|nr:alpha-glucan family phosphorylase [Deltaproteobacteria bacterium]
MMKTRHFYDVVPVLPDRIWKLLDLAKNIYWSWHPDAFRLFERVDRALFEATGHNPVKLLATVSQARVETLAQDAGFCHHMDEVVARFERYMAGPGWYDRREDGEGAKLLVAYFSAEFGLAQCLPVYSGGLGVLSGDHLKAASDLNLPLVGLGLLYRKGYFQQYVNQDGWQQERYQSVDIHNAPATLILDGGQPLQVEVAYPGRTVFAQVWRVDVGRVKLYLMDTHVPENNEEDQDIGDYLYGGGSEMRLKQELLLGVGGMRVIEALALHPTVFHMNEGHSAFLALERIRQTMTHQNLDFPAARAACARGNVFTTHTPVPAGFDLFPANLLERYLGPLTEQMAIPFDRIVAMGRGEPEDADEPFNMALFAARNANFVNGVSKLHGEVTKELFHHLTPDTPVHEIPVTSVTNGVHHRTWCSRDMTDLLTRYLGEGWFDDPTNKETWQHVAAIPDAELWRVHERGRAKLVTVARSMLRNQLSERGATQRDLAVADEILDPEVLTIGFARRFATYKRATLLFRDENRLRRLLSHPRRPIQIVFAGKAHPRDEAGKRLIQKIVRFSQDPDVRRRIVFLENYHIGLARTLVAGVDVWLNTPRRPMEASGTSGMKVVYNGGLNFSVLDGWWCEGYGPETGWAIGAGEDYDDNEYQDQVESEALYHTLENDIVPAFYDRDESDLPRGWVSKMKASMAQLGPFFNTHRMVRDYHDECYAPAAEDSLRLAQDSFFEARQEALWRERIRSSWSGVEILSVDVPTNRQSLPVGSSLHVSARVRLSDLATDDVSVEAYVGPVDEHQRIEKGEAFSLDPVEHFDDGTVRYEGDVPCNHSGSHGMRIRIRPHRSGVRTLFAPVHWEKL